MYSWYSINEVILLRIVLTLLLISPVHCYEQEHAKPRLYINKTLVIINPDSKVSFLCITPNSYCCDTASRTVAIYLERAQVHFLIKIDAWISVALDTYPEPFFIY